MRCNGQVHCRSHSTDQCTARTNQATLDTHRACESAAPMSSIADSQQQAQPIPAALLERIQFLIQDLLNLKEDDRLVWDALHAHSTVSDQRDAELFSSLFLSSLYFTREERHFIANFREGTKGPTLSELVRARTAEKFSSGTRTHVCSSHDLAPIFRRVFGLEHDFYKADRFKAAYKAFEKKLLKTMAKGVPTITTGAASAPKLAPAAIVTASSSASASSESESESVTVTPQLQKLRSLQAEQARLADSGSAPDEKLAKQIAALEKEVARMARRQR